MSLDFCPKPRALNTTAAPRRTPIPNMIRPAPKLRVSVVITPKTVNSPMIVRHMAAMAARILIDAPILGTYLPLLLVPDARIEVKFVNDLQDGDQFAEKCFNGYCQILE